MLSGANFFVLVFLVCVASEPEQPRATECPHLEFLLSEPEGGGFPLPEMLAWWLEERLPVS